ncbi:MAG: ATP-dependent Clp protease proteolytic subunit [Candidatus Bipolaricaulota bacterium]|nr:ATP-dependent Clp protease proteolytic subunit [Candidatus Bipolaricaulota bacterium]
MSEIVSLLFFLLLLQVLVPFVQRRILEFRRHAAIRALELKRKSRVITLIHRQEAVSFLGFTLARYIDIEDSEQVLRAIRMTPPDMPIDLILHTPGGLVLAAEQIACALKRHKGKVTVFVPHYAMSGGTLIALAADEIVMDPNAVLGPVDPQLATGQGYLPAASVLKALEQPNPNRDDHTLILGDIAQKAIRQVYETVYALLRDKLPEEKAQEVARMLSEGRWTHDYPITVEELRAMGLPVSEDMPKEVYELMELYPQAPQRRPGVEFIPVPYLPPARPSRGEKSP